MPKVKEIIEVEIQVTNKKGETVKQLISLKELKKLLGLAMVALFLTNCSSSQVKTKWTTPEYRIAIDSHSVSPADYVRIQEALMRSGKFFVVDRAHGFQASLREQDMEHGEDANRFGDAERYARMNKMFGVGSIVVGNVQCAVRHSFLTGDYTHCDQFLALVNANTAEVVAQVGGSADMRDVFYGEVKMASDWSDTVETLVDAIPKNYQEEKYDERMRRYRAEVREESIRERESK